MTRPMSGGLSVEVLAADQIDPAEYAEAAGSAFAGPPRTAREIAWKLSDNGYGEPLLSVARDERGRIAGVASFGAYRLIRGDGESAARLSYDTFVVPSARGRGLFGTLLREAEAIWRSTPVSFNFPNAASTPGFVAAGWRGVHRAQQFSTVVTPVGLRPGRARLADGSEHDIGPRTVASALSEAAVGAPPSPRHVAWRLDHPELETHLVTVRSVAVLASIGMRRGIRELRVLDAWSQQAPADILDAIRSTARGLRCPLATLPLSHPRPEIARLLRRRGWVERPSNALLHVWEGSDPAFRTDRWQLPGSSFHTW